MKNSSVVVALAALAFTACNPQVSHDQSVKMFTLKQVDLTSSFQGAAPVFDEKMTDAWGLEFGHTGRVWVNGSSGFSTVYDGEGKIVMTKDRQGKAVPLAVEVPMAAGITDEPAPLTGMVFSDKDDFSGDAFVFVTEQGTIAGWHKLADGFEPLTATTRVDKFEEGAVYKGVTSAKVGDEWRLYAANFGQDAVDVFDEAYKPVTLVGNFTDPQMPEEYAPFNIKEIKGELFVTFAKQGIDKANDVKSLGNGYISVFSPDGVLLRRFASEGHLSSPWGMALAPADFGTLSNMLLVGNFGDARINVFEPATGNYIGQIADPDGKPLQIDGLWSLTFGTDNGAGKHDELFFAAGPSAEDHGLYGKLELVK